MVFALTGFFLTKAAIEFDSSEPESLDEAVRALADTPGGTLSLLIVAFGMLAYAGLSFIEARWREIFIEHHQTVGRPANADTHLARRIVAHQHRRPWWPYRPGSATAKLRTCRVNPSVALSHCLRVRWVTLTSRPSRCWARWAAAPVLPGVAVVE